MKENTSEKTVDDLEAFLSGYSKPMDFVSDESTVIKPVENSPVTDLPKTPASEADWKGNPAYFQRGKKAGQLRPGGAKKQYANTQPPAGDPVQYNDIITGALLITLIDVLIPLLIAGINNLASKNKIDSNLLALSSAQKKSLEPVAEEAAKRISLQGNPVVILLVTLVGIYGMNFFMVKQLSNVSSK